MDTNFWGVNFRVTSIILLLIIYQKFFIIFAERNYKVEVQSNQNNIVATYIHLSKDRHNVFKNISEHKFRNMSEPHLIEVINLDMCEVKN